MYNSLWRTRRHRTSELYSTRWLHYLPSLIETNDLKFISSLYFISFYSLVYNYLTTWLSISKTKILLFIIFPHPPPTNDFGIWFSRAHISFCALIKLRSSRFQHLWQFFSVLILVPEDDMDYMGNAQTAITTLFFAIGKKRHQRQDANIATVNLLVENQMAADCAPANN